MASDYSAMEAALVSALISRASNLTTDNCKAGGHDEVVRYLIASPNVNYGAYTMFGGGNKNPEQPLIWIWHVRLVFLVRANVSSISEAETRLKTLLADVDLEQWRPISRLGGTALASRIVRMNAPQVVSYNRLVFYEQTVDVQIDVRYADAH